LRAPDREGEGEGEGNGRERKTTKEESKARIQSTTSEFIFTRNDCIYDIDPKQ